VIVTFKITRREFLRTWRRVYARRPQTWVTGVLTAAAWVLLWWVMSGDPAGAAIFGIVYLLFYVYLILVASPRGLWRKNTGLREERIQRFSTDGVEETRPNAHTTLKWAYFRDSLKIGEVYVLRVTRGRYTSIPWRVFDCAEDEARFRALASAGTGSTL
jgi:hypothetical protein